MANLIPKWVMLAYSKLFSRFDEKPFSSKQAKDILENKTAIVLHKLNKSGWIEFEGVDPEDSRKHFYKIIDPRSILKNLKEKDSNGKTKKTD